MASTRGMPVVSGEDCPGVAKSLHQWPATPVGALVGKCAFGTGGGAHDCLVHDNEN